MALAAQRKKHVIESKQAKEEVTKDSFGCTRGCPSAGKERGFEENMQEREKDISGGSSGGEGGDGIEEGSSSKESADEGNGNDDDDIDGDSRDGTTAEGVQKEHEDLEKLLGVGNFPEISVDLPPEFERQPGLDRKPCTTCDEIHSIHDKQCEVAQRLFKGIRTKINEKQYCDFEVYVLVPNLNSVRLHNSCILFV